MNKLAMILMFMLTFSIPVFADKMRANINFDLSSVEKIKIKDLTIENCNTIIKDNINMIPYNFIDIGNNIFQSNSENWHSYIECSESEIILIVQSKLTINQEYEILNSETLKEKINNITQSFDLLNFNNIR